MLREAPAPRGVLTISHAVEKDRETLIVFCSAVREMDRDELLINSLKTAFVSERRHSSVGLEQLICNSSLTSCRIKPSSSPSFRLFRLIRATRTAQGPKIEAIALGQLAESEPSSRSCMNCASREDGFEVCELCPRFAGGCARERKEAAISLLRCGKENVMASVSRLDVQTSSR
jgi:hypothetical protein